MKKRKISSLLKTLVCLVLCVVMLVPNVASAKVVGNENWAWSDNEETLSNVLNVKQSALNSGEWKTAVSAGQEMTVGILKDVKEIPSHAFNAYTGLHTVIWENPVLSGGIGEAAFANCTSLSSFSIPTGTTSIGKNAFLNCSSLTGQLVIPEGVTTIGEYAFANCTGITSVVLPSTIETIEKDAFLNCSGLVGTLTIPASVKRIGEGAFANCTNITTIEIIPTDVTIEKDAFTITDPANSKATSISYNAGVAITENMFVHRYAEVTFDANNGKDEFEIVKVALGTNALAATLTKTFSSPDGVPKKLIGWSGEKDGTVVDEYNVWATARVYGVWSTDDSYKSVTVENGGDNATTTLYGKESDTVIINAGSKSGYTFAGWESEDGITFEDASAAETTFTMPDKDVKVKAIWTENSTAVTPDPGSTPSIPVYTPSYYTITATAGDNGSISPAGSVSVLEGTGKTYTITADEGYEIADVLVDGKSVGAVSSYTFTNVWGSHSIEVKFEKESVPMLRFYKTVYVGSKFKLLMDNLDEDAKVTVTNTKKSVASASRAGVVTAKKAGKTMVTYTVVQNGQEYCFQGVITVKNDGYSLNLRGAERVDSELPVLNVYKQVIKGKTTKMEMLNLDEDAEVTYSSDNKKVAKVSKTGKITGVKKGKAVITATVVQNGQTYTYKMVVRVSDGTKDRTMDAYLK